MSMSIRNPYNLIEKANETFNLYLEKYEDIEKYMISSKKEQSEINHMFNSFLEKYDAINYKFLELFQNLIEDNDNNQKLIKNLESQIDILKKNNKDIINLVIDSNIKLDENNDVIVDNFKDSKEELDVKLKEVSNSFSVTNDLIGVESEKQLSEIRSLGDLIGVESEKQLSEIRSFDDSVSDELINVNVMIDSYSKKVSDEIMGLRNTQNNLKDFYINDLKDFLNSQKDINNRILDSVNLFTLNYDECKRCFFNDNEHLLAEYLDTDDLFRVCYFNGIQFLSYSPSENRLLLKTKEGIILSTNNRFYTIKEVIGFDGYSVPQLYQFDDFVVFDIGMNRAYASLRFAAFNNCSAVYGFEIDEDTYSKAIYNININPKLSEKITPYNFGLSNNESEVKLYYLEGADGINTVKQDFVDVQYEMIENKDAVKSKAVQVKKTSKVIGDIIKNNHIDSKIVLKIDTEGSEYDIVDDLIESGLIKKMDLIIGEGHNFNDRNISDDLLKMGFKEIEYRDNEIVYNFAFVKEEFYDVWPLKT